MTRSSRPSTATCARPGGDRHPVRAHVAVDGLLDLVIDQRFDPGTDPLRVQGDHRDHEHREDQAGDDHRSHADPEDAGHTEGPGVGGTKWWVITMPPASAMPRVA